MGYKPGMAIGKSGETDLLGIATALKVQFLPFSNKINSISRKKRNRPDL
jgi:hypothetical protein